MRTIFVCKSIFGVLIIVLFFGMINACAPIAGPEILLEIETDASETVYPLGKTLDLRVYGNRQVEFDFYLPNTPDRVGLPFTSERRKTKLSQEDFDNLKTLLDKSDLVNANSYYAPSRRVAIDARVKKTVIFKMGNQQKTIVLEENDSHLNFRKKSDVYPSSLIRLLELIEDINRKLRKQIDPESR